jgi:hypothetical protein
VLGGTLVAGPALAQLPSLFGESPPRLPADVPQGSSIPVQPPPVQFPGQAAPPPSNIQTQPLPPPPGGALAPAPPPGMQRARTTPPAAQPLAGIPPPAGSAPAASAPGGTTPVANAPAAAPPDAPLPPPDDTVITEMPTQKIENGRAVFSGLDKITGRIISFDAGVGETVQFGALRVTARVCYTRPPTEATNTDAFVEVDEVTLQGEIKRIFNGWMFAASPGLHAVEHPIYDVWLTDCAAPAPMKVAEPAPPPATPAAAATASRPPGAPKPRQNPPPRQPAAPQAAPMPPVQGQPN